MKVKRLIIYDEDKDYMERFVDYMNREQSLFAVRGFSSWEVMQGEPDLFKTDLFLLHENTEGGDINCLKDKRIIVLSEGTKASWGQAFLHVYKYQSMDEIYREVISFYWETEEGDLFRTAKSAMVIGIYSPVTRCLKTSLSLILAQILGRDQPLLLVNLEEFSGFSSIFQEEYKVSLSDAIYYFRHEKCLNRKLPSLVYKGQGFDYLPPVGLPGDLYSCPHGELADFITELGKEGGYEIIVVDIGTGCGNLVEILAVCDRIYMPVFDGRQDGFRVSSFESYLSRIGMECIIEKTEKIQSGRFLCTGNKNYRLEELLWSEFGDYVRHQIKGSSWNRE